MAAMKGSQKDQKCFRLMSESAMVFHKYLALHRIQKNLRTQDLVLNDLCYVLFRPAVTHV